MLQKNVITEIALDTPGFYSNIFLVHSVWRVASTNGFKTTEWPHLRTLLSDTHHKLSPEYLQKRGLRIQNRSAGCVLLCTYTYRQQYLCLGFENKVYQFRVLPFGLNTAPQVFTRLGHTVTAYIHRQGISVIPYFDDWLIHHPDRQALLFHQSQLLNTLDLVGLKLNKVKSELDQVQDIQFLWLRLHLDQRRASLPISKAQKIIAGVCQICFQTVLSYSDVSQFMRSFTWASGLNPPGRLHLRPLQ